MFSCAELENESIMSWEKLWLGSSRRERLGGKKRRKYRTESINVHGRSTISLKDNCKNNLLAFFIGNSMSIRREKRKNELVDNTISVG